jgi:hypothetical protein
MQNTTLKLYRSLLNLQFPDGPVINGDAVPGVLYPDFEERPLPNGSMRKADVDLDGPDKDGHMWVESGGGTSLFDRPNVFKGKKWLSFEIPEGTPVPPPLLIQFTGHNKALNANHYQIECRNMMRMDGFKGALDNLARSAIARSVELAKAKQG